MTLNKNRLMETARKYVAKGQVDRAIKEYLRIVHDDPNDFVVWLRIGDLYAKKGARQEAIEAYLKAARLYGENKFHVKAVAVYRQILRLNPELVEINTKLVEQYIEAKQLTEAIQHLEMVAAHFHRQGRTAEARAAVHKLVELDPTNVAARIKLAELYSKENLKDEAVVHFGHACHYLRAQNRMEDFIKVAERLLWHRPDDFALSKELADLYLQRDDPRRALQKLQFCFKAEPRNVGVLSLLADAFQALDQKAKTVSVLKEMARILDEDGNRGQAQEVHEKILSHAPDDLDSRNYLALAQSSSAARRAPQVPAVGSSAEHRPPVLPGRRLISASDLPPGVLSPTGSIPLVRGSTESGLGGHDRGAEPALEEGAPLEGEAGDGGSPEGEIIKILTETDVYVKYGLHQKAIDHVQTIFAVDPDHIEAHVRLKELLLAQGREEEAISELVKLAELTVSVDKHKAELFLRELLSINGTYEPALELARRSAIDLAADMEVEIFAAAPGQTRGQGGGAKPLGTTGAGGVIPVEQEFDLADVEWADAGGADPFDFALDGFSSPPAARPPGEPTGTEELAFDEVEAMAPLIPPEPELVLDDDEDFDIEDARAFDQEAAQAHRDHEAAQLLEAAHELDEGLSVAAEPEPLAGQESDALGAAAAATEVAEAAEFSYEESRELHAAEASPHADYATFVDDEGEIVDDSVFDAPTVNVPSYEQIRAHLGQGLADEIAAPSWKPRLEPAAGEAEPTEPAAEMDHATAATSLEDDLDEADFFMSQGLYEEARAILQDLIDRYPRNSLARARLKDLKAAQSAARDVDAPTPHTVLAAEQDTAGAAPAPHPSTKPTVLLQKPVADEDSQTHYDLGLAYKEMGLFDEAIAAFEKISHVPERAVQCQLMIGILLREQGHCEEAIRRYKMALQVGGITDHEKLSLYYEIGGCYEDLTDPRQAIFFYEMVHNRDPMYRDIARRLPALKAAVRKNGGGDGGGRRRALAGDESDAAIKTPIGDESDVHELK